MKQNKTKLSLEKEVISKLIIANIRGGLVPCSVTRRASDHICISDEPNCNSNHVVCDCDTTGNCLVGG